MKVSNEELRTFQKAAIEAREEDSNSRESVAMVSIIEELLALREVADAARRFSDSYWDEEGEWKACMAMEEALKVAGR